jgi:hypothetical protein
MLFAGCGPDDLDRLAQVLKDGRLVLPYWGVALDRLGLPDSAQIATELTALAAQGLSGTALAVLVGAVGEERLTADTAAIGIQLVATGPDPRERARDTAVVVEQLFGEAKESVLVAGFALYGGERFSPAGRAYGCKPQS